MFAPVLGDFVVDHAGRLVEDRLRIAVRPHRPVDRLPDVELLARAAMIPERQLVAVDLLGGDEGVPQVVAHRRLRLALVRAFQIKGVLVFIKTRTPFIWKARTSARRSRRCATTWGTPSSPPRRSTATSWRSGIMAARASSSTSGRRSTGRWGRTAIRSRSSTRRPA